MKSYLLHDSKNRTFWRRQNYGDNKKISSCLGLVEREGWKGKKDFNGREITLCETIYIVDICMLLYLFKPLKGTTSRVNPNIKYSLRVIMCHCRSIDFNKCTTPVVIQVTERTMHMSEQELYGQSLHLIPNLVVNLKLL